MRVFTVSPMSLFTLCDIPHDSHSFLITNHSPNVRATLTAIKKDFCLHLQKKKGLACTKLQSFGRCFRCYYLFVLKPLATDFSTVQNERNLALGRVRQSSLIVRLAYIL